MVAVPEAVVPIPTPINLGLETLIGIEETEYPEPTLSIWNYLIVPAADTVAVNAAEIGSLPGIINVSHPVIVLLYLFSS